MERFWAEDEVALKQEVIMQPKNGVRVGFWKDGGIPSER